MNGIEWEALEVGRESGRDRSRPDGESEDLGSDCDCGNGKEGIVQEMLGMASVGLGNCLNVRGGRGRNPGCLRF